MATSADIGIAKLRELRDVVGQIGTDGSKFFERGKVVVIPHRLFSKKF